MAFTLSSQNVLLNSIRSLSASHLRPFLSIGSADSFSKKALMYKTYRFFRLKISFSVSLFFGFLSVGVFGKQNAFQPAESFCRLKKNFLLRQRRAIGRSADGAFFISAPPSLRGIAFSFYYRRRISTGRRISSLSGSVRQSSASRCTPA